MPSAATAGSVQVRESVEADRAALTQSLADAFFEDPVACWAAPHDASRKTLLRRFFAAYLDAKQRHNTVWTDHFYLATLGVSPTGQGCGIGSALLAPVLEICDRDGVPAYLEASKSANIDYYSRHGFRVTGEIKLPRGPKVYPMWRDPRAAA